ncbi:MAG TPA: F0F1 ATP synthase subunit B [Longimicrobiaceae bacterium]
MMRNSLPLALMLLLSLATPAVAQEGGLLDINEGLMVWTVIIFLIVLLALYKFAYPSILGAVEAREARIEELLAAAQRDREEAQRLLEEQRAKHEELRSQVQEMVAEGRTAGERMRDEIIAEARREQQAILERARREIAQEAERARSELKAEAVELAIAAASKLVEKDLDNEGNRRFVREFLDRLEAEPAAAVSAGV